MARGEVHSEVGVAFDADTRILCEEFTQGFDALRAGLFHSFAGVDAYAHDDAVEESESASQQGFVPLGEGVETAGHDSYFFHFSLVVIKKVCGVMFRRFRPCRRLRHGPLPRRGYE